MKVLSSLAAAGLLLALLPVSAVAEEPAKAFATGMVPAGHILLPDGEPEASVVLISDAAGWGANEETVAAALTEKGAAVIGVDFPSYLKALQADDGDCRAARGA